MGAWRMLLSAGIYEGLGGERDGGAHAQPWHELRLRGNMCSVSTSAEKVAINSTPMNGFGEGGRKVWTTARMTLHATSAATPRL